MRRELEGWYHGRYIHGHHMIIGQPRQAHASWARKIEPKMIPQGHDTIGLGSLPGAGRWPGAACPAGGPGHHTSHKLRQRTDRIP
jgi:hypothetical protein